MQQTNNMYYKLEVREIKNNSHLGVLRMEGGLSPPPTLRMHIQKNHYMYGILGKYTLQVWMCVLWMGKG